MPKNNMFRRILIYSLTLLTPLIMIAIGLELYTRLIVDNGMEYNLEMWKYAREIKQISADPRIAHEHIPLKRGHFMGQDVSINSRGLRDREFPNEKTQGTIRILMLGDSLTFGWGVAQEKTTPKILEKILNSKSSNPVVEVINTGVGNYNTDMEVGYFLARGYQWNPDIVILNYFINDAEPTPRYHGNFLSEHSYAAVYFGGIVDTILRRFMGNADYENYYSNLYRENEKGWLQTQKAVQELSAYCRENNVPLMIANYPELRILKNYRFMNVTEKIKALAQENSVPFVDLYENVKNEPENTLWVTVQDPHPNAKACALFAQGLHDVLIKEKLLPTPSN